MLLQRANHFQIFQRISLERFFAPVEIRLYATGSGNRFRRCNLARFERIDQIIGIVVECLIRLDFGQRRDATGRKLVRILNEFLHIIQIPVAAPANRETSQQDQNNIDAHHFFAPGLRLVARRCWATSVSSR
ncbi:hypothetical protein D3C83_18930 [compost metagenome]